MLFLGSVVPQSGGMYTYTQEAYGDLFGFLNFYSMMFLGRTLSTGMGAVAFAKYSLYPLFQDCEPPDTLVKIVGILTISKHLYKIFNICIYLKTQYNQSTKIIRL